jgi:DNA-binding transcriptional regulator YiaG
VTRMLALDPTIHVCVRDAFARYNPTMSITKTHERIRRRALSAIQREIARGTTQAAVAARLGTTQATVSRWLLGRIVMPAEVAERVVKTLKGTR